MEQEYKALRDKAIGVESAFRRMLDDRDHRVAQAIWHDFTALIVDIRQCKHPKSIDDRMARIQQQLLSVRDGAGKIMRVDENVDLYQRCEQLRLGLRKMSNY